MPTVKELNRTHPAHDAEEIGRMRGLYEGGKAWRKHVGHWLPQLPEEPSEQYKNRSAAALYENHFGPALDLFTAHMFSETPTLAGVPESGNAAAYWHNLSERADAHAMSWSAFWRERLTTAMWAGRSWVWMDLPRPREDAAPATLADQLGSGALDAYLRAPAPESVINWNHDDAGLAWVVIASVAHLQDGPLGASAEVHRWTVIDRERILVYEVPTKNGEDPREDTEASLVGDIAHGWDRVPVIEMALPSALWLGARMRDPAVAHVRQRNELSWALRRAAVVLLALTERAGSPASQDPERPTVGHAWSVRLTRDDEGADEIKFVEPAGSAYSLLAEDVERLEKAFYRTIHQAAVAVDPSAARVQSGASKAADWVTQQIVMSAIAPAVRDAMRDTARAIAKHRMDPVDAIEIHGLDGWQSLDLDELTALNDLLADAKTASPTLFSELAKLLVRRVHGISDAALADIMAELDAFVSPTVAASRVAAIRTEPAAAEG